MIDVELLKRNRAALVKAMRSVTVQAQKESRRMSDEEAREWDAKDTELKALTEDIKRAERSNQLEMDDSDEPSDNQPDTPEDRSKFGSYGEFLIAVRSSCIPGNPIDERLMGVDSEGRAATGQNVGVASDGGFLVGTQDTAGVFARAYDESVVADACRKIIIGSGLNGIRMNGIDENSRVAGSRYGGVRAYWQAEANTVTASKIKFNQIKMDLEKLMCFVYATDESLEDAMQLEDIITGASSAELAFKLDEAIIEGPGGGMPTGVLNSDALVTVAKEAGQAPNTVVYENILNMRARLWAKSRQNMRWYINQDIEPELQSMAMVVGTGGVPVYLPATGISGKPYDTLFGAPVIPIEHCETVGTKGDIILMDPSQYLLIDKGGIKKAVSIHVRFLYEENCFRFTYRVNGQTIWSKPLTPKKGSNTQSPFVTLATRA